MKKVVKVRCNTFSILYILISIVQVNNKEEINENNISKFISNDCVSVSSFIEKNLNKFVYEYNNENNSKWNATSIEDKKEVIDIENDEKYIYLDFNDDNGYAIVGNNYNFLDFSITGDLEYTKNVDELYFSKYDGFIYLKGNQYVSYETSYLNEEELINQAFNYDGKEGRYSSGADVINNPFLYLKSRYGGDWYKDESNYLNNYQDVYQEDYTVYTKSEGNCTLSAYYGIFRYLRDNKGFKKLPNQDSYIDFSKDVSFNDGVTINKYSLPSIYVTIRDCAMKYGYTTESSWWTSVNMKNWGNMALSMMGYPNFGSYSYITMCVLYTFYTQVKLNIDLGYPVMWNQANGNYGNHSMVVKGYEIYKQQYKVWFFTLTKRKHLMAINDNWKSTSSTTYIDYDGFRLEGYGTFIEVKDYWMYSLL